MIKANWKWTNDIETEILTELQDVKGLIVHVCSATSGIGDVRIDRWLCNTYEGSRKIYGLPNIKADYRYIPVRSGCAAAVICDPPYSPERRSKEFPLMVEELVRIAAPGGKIIFVAPWVLYHPAAAPLRFWMRPVSTYPTYKILSVSMKINAQIDDYLRHDAQLPIASV